MILIKNGRRVVRDNELQRIDILVDENKIVKIEEEIEVKPSYEVIDVNGKLVTPGFIDTHVHLREPGMTHKETIESGSKAGLFGGYTQIFAMPNVIPVPDTKEKMLSMYDRANKDAHIKVKFYSPISMGEKGEELVNFKEMMEASSIGFTDDGRGLQNAGLMHDAMEEGSKLDFVICAHCEENTLIRKGYIHKGEYAKKNGHDGIMSSCEDVQIARDILLSGENNSRYHICHMSTKRGVDLLELGQKWGYRVSGEVTPHHLLLDDGNLNEHGDFKMNPPLRSFEDRQRLVEGLNKGIIKVIATDHAPHSKSEKSKGLARSPFGIIGLENAFSLVYTDLVKTNKITLETLVNGLTKGPKEVFNLKEGEIEEGSIADITVIDLEKEYEIKRENFHSMSENSPFVGKKVFGVIDMVMVEGKVKLLGGKIN